MNDVQPKRRPKRSAPKKSTPAVTAPAYDFPSLDDILRMSETQVLESFSTLGIEPSPFRWIEDDDQANGSHWHDYGMQMTDADRLKSVPSMKVLKATAQAIHNDNLRMELMSAYLHHWIDGLDDDQLIAEIERISETKFSVSEVRYAKISDLKQRVQELVWPELVVASTLYVQPINPLTGGI